MAQRRTSRNMSVVSTIELPGQVEELPPIEYNVPEGIKEGEFEEWRASSRASMARTPTNLMRKQSNVTPTRSKMNHKKKQIDKSKSNDKPKPVKAKNEVEHHVPNLIPDTKSSSTVTASVVFKSFRVLIFFTQCNFLSFFAFNEDMCLKVTFTIMTDLFLLVSIVINIPCFFNCFLDFHELRVKGFTVELLQIIQQYVLLVHIMSIQWHFMTNGGRIKRFLAKLEAFARESKVTTQGKKAFWLCLQLTALITMNILSALLQAYLLICYQNRRILRSYQPNAVKVYFAKEGQGKYVYEYEPIVNLGDDFLLWLTLSVKFFAHFQTFCLPIMSFHWSNVVSSIVPSICQSLKETDESGNLIDLEHESIFKKTSNSSNTSTDLLQSFSRIDRVVRSWTFISLLFNAVSGLLSLTIIFIQSAFIYLIPYSNPVEVYQIFVSLVSITVATTSGSKTCRILNESRTRLNQKEKTEQASTLVSKGQQIILSVVTGMVIIFLLLISSRIQDTKILSNYDPKQTRNWLSEVTSISFKEAKKKLMSSILMKKAYLHPSFFKENN